MNQTAQVTQPVLEASLTVLKPYQKVWITDPLWLAILKLLWRLVEPAAYSVAETSREFFDSEFKRQVPELPVPPVFLAKTTFEGFVQDMEPVRRAFAREDASDNDVINAAMRVARTVENAGRRTMIRAVEQDFVDAYIERGFSESDARVFAEDDLEYKRKIHEVKRGGKKLVQGWARVPTGRETCGFCWMLCSRGPQVYSFKSGGGKGSEDEYISRYQAGELNHKDHMNEWHTGCDCKLVPVFDLENWEGMDRWKAAEELWKDSTLDTYGQDSVNAFRRAVEDGGIQKYMKRAAKAA